MRPLWYEFPQDEDTFSEQHNFMLGGSRVALHGLGHPPGPAAAWVCRAQQHTHCARQGVISRHGNRQQGEAYGRHTSSHAAATPCPSLPCLLAGPSLLVAPVLDAGATEVPVLLPGGGVWYDNLDGTAIDAGQPAHRNFRWGKRGRSGEGGGVRPPFNAPTGEPALSAPRKTAAGSRPGVQTPVLAAPPSCGSPHVLHSRAAPPTPAPLHPAAPPSPWSTSAPTCAAAPC